VAVFRKNDITIGLAVWDTFGVFHDEIVDMRRLADAEGLGLDHLLVAATHNHNSFDSIGIDGPGFVTGRNPEHNGHAQAMTIEALGEALQNARPVSLEATSVLTPEAWTRDSRLPVFIDRELRLLRAIDDNGDVVGTIVLWSNHVEA